MIETAALSLQPVNKEWLLKPAILPENLLPKEPKTGLTGELAQVLARDARVNFDCYEALVPHSDIAIGKQTPVTRLRHYTNSLFQTLHALTENTNYPPLEDLEKLEGTNLSQLYLQATQALIGQVDQLIQEEDQTKLAVVLTAVTRNTEYTGWLLKFIDQGRGQGNDIKRPQSLDELWGPETAKPVPSRPTDKNTSQWLQTEEPNLENLTNQLQLALLKTIGGHLRTSTVLNSNLYKALLMDELLETRFGNGNSPAQELPHEVNNIINRLRLLNPQSQFPPAEVVLGLSTQDQLKLYVLMAGELLKAYQNPQTSEHTYMHYGKSFTGRQLLINALRHSSQHSGTLAAFLEQK